LYSFIPVFLLFNVLYPLFLLNPFRVLAVGGSLPPVSPGVILVQSLRDWVVIPVFSFVPDLSPALGELYEHTPNTSRKKWKEYRNTGMQKYGRSERAKGKRESYGLDDRDWIFYVLF
jgi:hypothetical protein